MKGAGSLLADGRIAHGDARRGRFDHEFGGKNILALLDRAATRLERLVLHELKIRMVSGNCRSDYRRKNNFIPFAGSLPVGRCD